MGDYRFKKDSDREECMNMIEQCRRENLYPHSAEMCTDDCRERGTYMYMNTLVNEPCLVDTPQLWTPMIL